MQSKAILFDMDGTLFDSERLWDMAIDDLVASYEVELPLSVRMSMVGHGTDQSMRILLEGIGQPWRDPLDGAERIHNRMEELFASSLEWRPGALELLTQVRAAGLPHALVTSTIRRLVKVALGVSGPFHAEVCGDDVANVKPHPEPYLTAAAMLGVDPRDCLVFEDSPSGVLSAVAAGMRVVAIPHAVPIPEMPGVTFLDSLTEFRL